MNELKNKTSDNIVYKTNKSPVLLFFRIFLFIFIVNTFLFIFYYILYFMEYDIKSISIFATVEDTLMTLFIFIIASLIFFLYLFVSWFMESYQVEEGKITHRYGILFKNIDLYTIGHINTIQLKQSLLGRIFQYGDVIIYYNERKFVFKYMHYPEYFINIINTHKIGED